MSTLYERIIKQTEKNGITGKKLGEILGLKKSPLTDWKNNKSSPTLEQIIKMCNVFAISADYLLYGEDATDLSEDELRLLDLYKNTNDIGQPLIIKHAADTQNALPREKKTDNTETELKSSDLKIG